MITLGVFSYRNMQCTSCPSTETCNAPHAPVRSPNCGLIVYCFEVAYTNVGMIVRNHPEEDRQLVKRSLS